jgi:hypothetical protein
VKSEKNFKDAALKTNAAETDATTFSERKPSNASRLKRFSVFEKRLSANRYRRSR